MVAALMCLALTIYHEARGEPFDGQVAVAQVVMNRVHDPRYPDDVCSVVHQGPVNWKGSPVIGACQFKWWCDGKSDEARDDQSLGRALAVAALVMADLMDDRVNHATHFHHVRSRPDWGLQLTRQIGKHHFYR